MTRLRLLMTGLPPLRGLLPLVVLLVVWQILQPGPSPYFPAPSEWWSGIAALTRQGRLMPAVVATMETFVVGLAIAIVVATALGLMIGVWSAAARALGPLLEFLRAIPPPATVPIAVLLLGYDERMKLTVVALAATWPILLNTASAAARVDPLLLDVARSFRLSLPDRIRRVIAPAVVPAVLLGIRVAIPLAIIVTLLVEILTSVPGVGALMIAAQRNFQSGQVYGLLVLVGLLGFVVNDLFAAVETIILRRFPPRSGAA